MHLCFYVCSVLSCYVWMFFMYIVCHAHICMYLCTCVYLCVYIYVCTVHLCAYNLCLCMCWYIYTHFYLYNKCLSCRWHDLGCCLLVWHCYLGSILAFSFEFQNLNRTICTKTSNKTNRNVSRVRGFATGLYWYGIPNSYPKLIKLKMLKEF